MSIIPAHYVQPSSTDQPWQPRQVFLFSGHLIDAPDRSPPRFPKSKESIAAQQIAKTLDQFGADDQDLGLTQGANGGDILFAEACQQKGVKLQLLQPFEEAEFIKNSVIPGHANWLSRYHAITQKLDSHPLNAPEVLGPLAAQMNAYERCNLWLLESAFFYGKDKVRLICLWDGSGEGRVGGTAHMVEEVRKRKGQVIWLDTRQLW